MKRVLLVLALIVFAGCVGGEPEPTVIPTTEPVVEPTIEPTPVVEEPSNKDIALDLVKDYLPEDCSVTLGEYIDNKYDVMRWIAIPQDDEYGVALLYKGEEGVKIGNKTFTDYRAAAFLVDLETEEIAPAYFDMGVSLADTGLAEDNAIYIMLNHMIDC